MNMGGESTKHAFLIRIPNFLPFFGMVGSIIIVDYLYLVAGLVPH